MRAAPHLDPVLQSPRGHFFVVSAVALAALQLGQAMGLPPRALEVLVRGTLVHDVGKLAVVDVYDALTSDRAYRRSWTPAQARAYVREHARTQFDPEVVEVWLSLQSEPATQPRAGGHTGGVKRPSTAVHPPSTTSTEPVT